MLFLFRFLYVDENSVTQKEIDLAPRYQQASRPIKGIRSYHYFKPSPSGLVAHSLSCDTVGTKFPWIINSKLSEERSFQNATPAEKLERSTQIASMAERLEIKY